MVAHYQPFPKALVRYLHTLYELNSLLIESAPLPSGLNFSCFVAPMSSYDALLTFLLGTGSVESASHPTYGDFFMIIAGVLSHRESLYLAGAGLLRRYR